MSSGEIIVAQMEMARLAVERAVMRQQSKILTAPGALAGSKPGSRCRYCNCLPEGNECTHCGAPQ